MRKGFILFTGVFVTTFIMCQGIVMWTGLDSGETIGRGWYLLKHVEETEFASKVEVGEGVITIPLVAGVGSVLLYGIIQPLRILRT